MRAGMMLAALLLGGCGGSEKAEESPVIASVGDGAGELRKDGMKLGDLDISTNPESSSCKRPDFVPLPPGATVTGCMAQGASGGQVMFKPAGSAAETIAFYKAAAVKAGLTESVMEQGSVYMASGKDGRSIAATATGDGFGVIWGTTRR